MVIACISIFCEGGHFVLLPAHCAKVFGSSQRGIKAFSLIFSCFGLSSLSGSFLVMSVIDQSKNQLNSSYSDCDPYK